MWPFNEFLDKAFKLSSLRWSLTNSWDPQDRRISWDAQERIYCIGWKVERLINFTSVSLKSTNGTPRTSILVATQSTQLLLLLLLQPSLNLQKPKRHNKHKFYGEITNTQSSFSFICFVLFVLFSYLKSHKGQFTQHCFIITTLWGAMCTVWQISSSEQKSGTDFQATTKMHAPEYPNPTSILKKDFRLNLSRKNSTQQQNQQIRFADLLSFRLSSLSWFPEEEPRQGIEGQEEHLFLPNSVITRNTAVGENFCTHTPRTEFGTHFFFPSFFLWTNRKIPIAKKKYVPTFLSFVC